MTPINSNEDYGETCKEFQKKYSVYLELDVQIQGIVRQFEMFGERLSRCSTSEDEETIVVQIQDSYDKVRPTLAKLVSKYEELQQELTIQRRRIDDYIASKSR